MRILKARVARLAALICLPLALTGCGAGIGDATGKVTYQGKSVVCGSVVFVGPDGMTKAGPITNGTYTIKGVGAGRVLVGVVSEDPARPLDPYKVARGGAEPKGEEPVDDSGKAPAPGRVVPNPTTDRSNWAEPNVDRSKWFPLPRKYEIPINSGLAVELKSGSNEGIDIELP